MWKRGQNRYLCGPVSLPVWVTPLTHSQNNCPEFLSESMSVYTGLHQVQHSSTKPQQFYIYYIYFYPHLVSQICLKCFYLYYCKKNESFLVVVHSEILKNKM